MTDRDLIDIPVYPDLPNVTRKAYVEETHNKYGDKSSVMTVFVLHFIDGKEIFYLPKTVYLRADNTVYVNPLNMQYVTANEAGEYPEGSEKEFDLLYRLVKEKVYSILELEDMFINLRIDEINEKLYKTIN